MQKLRILRKYFLFLTYKAREGAKSEPFCKNSWIFYLPHSKLTGKRKNEGFCKKNFSPLLVGH